MAINAQDIQLRELKDTIVQLNETVRGQNDLIKSLQKTIERNAEAYSTLQEKLKVLQEQNDYLTKKTFR